MAFNLNMQVCQRSAAKLLLIFFCFGLASCASMPPDSDPYAQAEFQRLNDPLEPTNRVIHGMNQRVDKILIEPIAVTYGFIVPKPLRKIVTNVLRNAAEPLTFVNDVLQGEPERAGNTLTRFLTNSTLGAGGSIDVATDMGLERHVEDFGQTLAVWGVGEGPYLVLPFLGPSTMRDGIGRIGEVYADPAALAIDRANVKGLSIARMCLTAIDARHRNLDTLRELEESSIDLYATMRSAYRQNRRAEVRNGAPLEEEDDFDIFDDFDDLEDEPAPD